jgi:hypothetical protein
MNLDDIRITEEMRFFFNNINKLNYQTDKSTYKYEQNYYKTINNYVLHINVVNQEDTIFISQQRIFKFKSLDKTLNLFIEENMFFDILNKIVPILNVEIRKNIKKEEEHDNLRKKERQEQEIKKNLILKNFLNT